MDFAYEKAMGEQIRKLREQRGWTQEMLSAKLQTAGCDITRSALAKIEVGQRHIYPQEIKALQNILQVPYELLFV